MRIAVAYKWAPNPQDALVGSDGRVDWSHAKAGVSEYDPVAIALGRSLADASGAELVGLSVGGSDVASPMAKKSALARGLDRAVVVADASLQGLGATETALLLAALVEKIGDVDVVLTGDSSIDEGSRMVPTVLGGALGWPALTDVRSVSGTAGDLSVERNHRGGSQVLRLTGPAVLAAAVDAVVPGVPGVRDILAAGKKPVEEVALTALVRRELGSSVERVRIAGPEVRDRKRRMIEGSDAAVAAHEIVAALRADGVI